MSLKEQIESDVLTAFKAKKEYVVSTLRILKSAIKNEEIGKKTELTDDDVMKVIKREVKQRRDSIAEYKKGNRDDLAKKEADEIEILNKYLPAELPEEEVEKIVEATLTKMGEVSQKDFGLAMKEIMKAVAGKAGGDVVGKILKSKLEEKK